MALGREASEFLTKGLKPEDKEAVKPHQGPNPDHTARVAEITMDRNGKAQLEQLIVEIEENEYEPQLSEELLISAKYDEIYGDGQFDALVEDGMFDDIAGVIVHAIEQILKADYEDRRYQ